MPSRKPEERSPWVYGAVLALAVLATPFYVAEYRADPHEPMRPAFLLLSWGFPLLGVCAAWRLWRALRRRRAPRAEAGRR